MKLNKKSGFTLLEIIIVIIIIGVLASLALPKFFSTIQFAKSTEAMNALGEIRRAADRCAMMDGVALNYGPCSTFGALGLQNPASTTWNYVIVNSHNVGVLVRANFLDSAALGNYINFYITPTGVTKGGIGIFSGIR